MACEFGAGDNSAGQRDRTVELPGGRGQGRPESTLPAVKRQTQSEAALVGKLSVGFFESTRQIRKSLWANVHVNP